LPPELEDHSLRLDGGQADAGGGCLARADDLAVDPRDALTALAHRRIDHDLRPGGAVSHPAGNATHPPEQGDQREKHHRGKRAPPPPGTNAGSAGSRRNRRSRGERVCRPQGKTIGVAFAP
jgi:hypothetical protein